VAGVNAARGVVSGKGGRGGSRRMDYSVVPSVVFTDPPFARVGLSEREAREQGVRYVVSRVDYINVAVAEVLGQTRGFVKLLAEPGGGRLVGAQVLGHQAETLIHEVSTAMSWGIRAGQLAHAPHFHPSPSEILVEAAEKLGGR
jgi:pyruvate/2-oxoglutarate dehydrogenase complex dihydrolipoamide dehydrogenase (E3) component